LLAGSTVAMAQERVADKGDRGDRGSNQEQKSKNDRSRRGRPAQGADQRYGRPSDRPVVDRRGDQGYGQPSDRPVVDRRSDQGYGRPSDRPVVERRDVPRQQWNDRRQVVQREPQRWNPRDGRMNERQVAGREPQPLPRERWNPREGRVSERAVTRMRTPAGWNRQAVRGRAQYATWENHRANRWVAEHRTWGARGGYSGYRIPYQRYRYTFGPTHRFIVDRCPLVVVGGYPRFYYGGYWVTFIDPWPEYWADDWYYDDDCYIVYVDDGYYLTNVRYPGVRIAVSFMVG
jgi:hypothetical protein